MKANKKTALALAALGLAALLMLGLWHFTRPQPQAGEKTVTVEVIHTGESSKSFICHTSAEYLGEMLLAEGIVAGDQGAYGLYITTVDGETAQDALRQWWCVTKEGQQVDTGADTTPIADGDHFELTLSIY